MRAEFLPFSRPTIDERDHAAVRAVLDSGWITTGPKAAQFEEAFRAYVGGAGGAVAVTSATAGLHLALQALDIGPGDEVITPSMTWVSTANLIALCGATPVFVDVDRDTLMAGVDRIEAAITARTRLIVPVHFAGAPVDLAPIRRLATREGITVVEDAAHALGTEYRGERIGRTGTAIFSFHPIKNITTGEGGMICSDDEDFLARVRRLKFHGLGVDAFDRERGGRAPQAEVIEPGFKYNLPDLLAALGLAQLARVDAFNARRTALAALYHERLAGIDGILPLGTPPWPARHAWHLFVVRLDTDRAGLPRDRFMAELKARNIGTGLHFRAIHTQAWYRAHPGVMPPGGLPETEWNSDRICSLPLFPSMEPGDVDDVVDTIRDVLQGAKR